MIILVFIVGLAVGALLMFVFGCVLMLADAHPSYRVLPSGPPGDGGGRLPP